MKKFGPLLLFLAAVVAAVFIVLKANSGDIINDNQTPNSYNPKPGEADPAGRIDYTKPPIKDAIQRCDPLVIDAWRQLNGVHTRFLERYNRASRDERLKMKEEITNLFAWYDPDDETVKDIKDDATPEKLAKKAIWQVGYKFEKAIKENPANASNFVSFGVFLKARDEVRALECFEKGRQLWPSNYAFHWMIADFLYRAPSSHGFTVFDVIHPQQRRLQHQKEIYSCLDLAEKNDPDNSFVPIYRAQTMISFGEDAVTIYDQFAKAVETTDYPCFYEPPPRPAKSLNWFTAANALTRTQDMHYDIERNYGFYLDKVIDRWITQGGLREAAERKGPSVFITSYRLLYRMGATDPFDRTFFYMAINIATVMREYYKAHNLQDAVIETDSLIGTCNIIDSKLRNNCITNTNWAGRLPVGVDPLDTEKIPLSQIEMFLRRANPALRILVDDYNPRLVRECTSIVEKYAVEPDETAKGKFWKPQELIEQALESGFPKEIPVDPNEIPPTAEQQEFKPDASSQSEQEAQNK